MTSQISDLAKKINVYNDRVQTIEQQIDKAIIPALNELSKIVDNILERNKQFPTQTTHQQFSATSCQEMIQALLHNQQTAFPQTPQHKRHRQIMNLTQIQPNQMNNTQKYGAI